MFFVAGEEGEKAWHQHRQQESGNHKQQVPLFSNGESLIFDMLTLHGCPSLTRHHQNL